MHNWMTHPEPPLSKAEVKAREAFFTPPMVADQVVREALKLVKLPKRPRLLDPSSGPGIFCQAMRFRGPATSHITAIDIEGKEIEHMRRNADEAMVGDFLEYEPKKKISLIATNPPFSLFYEFIKHGLEIAEHVWLFAPIDPLWRGKAGIKRYREVQAHVQYKLIVPGGIGFKGINMSDTDMRTYAMWCLSRKDTGEFCKSTMLDPLTNNQRSWVGHRPGTYDYTEGMRAA